MRRFGRWLRDVLANIAFGIGRVFADLVDAISDVLGG